MKMIWTSGPLQLNFRVAAFRQNAGLIGNSRLLAKTGYNGKPELLAVTDH